MRFLFLLIPLGFSCFGVADGVPGVTKNTIRLGQSAAFKGPSGDLGIQLWRGAHAYFEKTNAQGGVHGRKIEVVSLNDSYEPDLALENTIKLVKLERVFALFGYVGTPTIVRALPAIQKFHNEEGLFLFSNYTGAQPQREPPHLNHVFNVRASYRKETEALVNFFYKQGLRKFGLFIQSDAYGRSGADGVTRALKGKGLKAISETTYTRGAALSESMMEQVRILKLAGVEVIISVGSYNACAAFIRDARTTGFNGPIANVSFVGPSALLAILEQLEKDTGKSYSESIYQTLITPPFEAIEFPVVQEFNSDMERFRPAYPESAQDPVFFGLNKTLVALEGYLNAKVFVEILRRIPRDRLTRLEFERTAKAVTNLDVGLGRFKLNFAQNRPQGLDVVFLTQIKNGRFVEVTPWPEKK